MKRHYYLYSIGLMFLTALQGHKALGQAEVTAWGNITALRNRGQPVYFEGSICLVSKSWKNIYATALEQQSPQYDRHGRAQVITTKLDSIYITEKIKGRENGKAKISVKYKAKRDLDSEGLFYRIDIDEATFNNVVLIASDAKHYDLKDALRRNENKPLTITTTEVVLAGNAQQLKVDTKDLNQVVVKKGWPEGHIQIFLPLQVGAIANNQHGSQSLTMEVSGHIDTHPVIVNIDSAKQGRLFAGFGGNFRLQNPATDPQVINYCLDNMRVAWGRVEMPFAQWQPELNSDPIQLAKNGRLDAHVQQSMEMAQQLQRKGIPIILTSWNAPNWAIIGEPHSRPKPGEQWGNPLKPETIKATYKGIADYIVYLKDVYGVDIKLFSFNESDLGINIRVTAQEHDELIKGLGAYFASRGLKTKMLLGDNSDANSYEFIYPALNDPETLQYIGAISFHSWRGWGTTTLTKWYDAAQKSGLPLIVGEGSIDAAAWAYPKIFEEEAYARQEINLYLRLLSICQPISILQWQLTADYSPLIGGGIFGNDEPLHPGQRFWNLKQFASVPKDVFYLQASTDAPNITCAALGNKETGEYAVHFVNNGATREVQLNGLPANITHLDVFITDRKYSMKKSVVNVMNGTASFMLPTLSFTSLMTSESK